MEFVQRIDDDLYAEAGALPGARLYHLKPWHKVLERCFGWRVGAWLARESSGRLDFYLPVVRKRTASLKIGCTALPLSHHVAPLGRWPDSANTQLAGVKIHAPLPGTGHGLDKSRVITELDLSASHDEAALFGRFSESSIRRKVKKAVKAGYALRNDTADTLLKKFSHLQAETRRRQGSPTFPADFFHVMAEELGECFHMHTATDPDGVPVAAIIFLDDGETSIYGYGASVDRRDIWQDGVNQAVMWDAIKAAYARGMRTVDFGASPKSQPSLIQYKEKWDGVSRELSYTVVACPQAGAGVARDSLPVRAASLMLKHMPLGLFKQTSPLLLKLAA